MHSGDGQWEPVSRHCLGYSQVSALADAYLAPDAFTLPALPSQLRGYGAEIDIRSTVVGTIASIVQQAMERIRAVPFYISEAIDKKPGDEIGHTVDALTIAGGI